MINGIAEIDLKWQIADLYSLLIGLASFYIYLIHAGVWDFILKVMPNYFFKVVRLQID